MIDQAFQFIFSLIVSVWNLAMSNIFTAFPCFIGIFVIVIKLLRFAVVGNMTSVSNKKL